MFFQLFDEHLTPQKPLKHNYDLLENKITIPLFNVTYIALCSNIFISNHKSMQRMHS